ncbi:5'/3'-nucleotidase SurE [Derxia gummosa]|uniref:5'-nucleotidase SurE n=1 Tax=Derxia gummosa DSM 723 TaxID=1121388 RepID=A0A8B6X6J0_9BURK|nr:5'/3'-nucleotidase SurE [Derxia gummosa]
MRILVSNDDGYSAPGIEALAVALGSFAEVTVVAPDRNRSGASHSLTLDRPLRLTEVGDRRYHVDGTPTDCVHVALTGGLLVAAPDLVVSGINNGANLGDDTMYSGTVAAAMEAYLFGLPAIAFSLCTHDWAGLDRAAEAAAALVRQHVTRPLPAPFLLSVNFPVSADPARCTVTRLGKRHVSEPVIREYDVDGRVMFRIGAVGNVRDAGPGSDFHAVASGLVSVTPLHHDLTHTARLDAVRGWLGA